MIVYEKDNKLNISFENSIENPDFEFSKDEANFGNANIVSAGSAGSGVFIVTLTYGSNTFIADKTMKEMREAAQTSILLLKYNEGNEYVFTPTAYSIEDEFDHLLPLNSSMFISAGFHATYSDNNTIWELDDDK